jgi:hypothetical protein
VKGEFYVAMENVLFFLDTRVNGTTYNSYTGEENEGQARASYEMPFPLPSIGFKWTY